MINLFENIPYQDDRPGRRKILDEKHILVMQIALKKGQSVPEHFANSNVNILVLDGEINLNLDGEVKICKKGDLVSVHYKTKMAIFNMSDLQTTFLVIKTPNPSEM